MSHERIIEYAYNADTYCPRHVLKAIGKRQLPGKSVEDSLAVYATAQGISYTRGTHDSNAFPFPSHTGIDEFHYGQMCGELGIEINSDGEPHCYAICAICHEPLGGYCPQMDAITHAEKEAREGFESWPTFAEWREQNDGGSLSAYKEAAWAAFCAQDEKGS